MNINKKIYKNILSKYPDLILGKHLSEAWMNDPKHLLFSLSRYKFVSKLLEGYKKVLEVGAGDGFLSRIIDQNVNRLDLCDIEIANIEYFKKIKFNKNKYFIHDFSKKISYEKYDAIYSIDVIEHISPKKVNKFMKNQVKSLAKNGTLIIGTPSQESQRYSSKYSKMGHVNVYTKSELRKFCYKYFNNVFVFSMNDEIIHTGYDKMSQYLFALCIK
jgi:2-polyprenyl-3-methyl-5-hydroxy-6-metoxy-1,4-benzoquinol methylase